MAVVIRLKRMGPKNRPLYKIVVIEKRSKRDGKNIEEIGFYNPLEKPPIINLNRQKWEDWLKKGAQPSSTVKEIAEK